MPLIDQHKRGELQGKTLKQIVGFAGDGRLLDKSSTSLEFREWLGHIKLKEIRAYAKECLESKSGGDFKESGRALQDIVNEVGRRLGFQVEDGRYRGVKNAPGHDGIWRLSGDRAIVVEVKTTDTYSIDLDTLAKYRQEAIESGKLPDRNVSVLLVVGLDGTGVLEAQIRGSRHAWDMRVISVDALLKIAEIKERVEEPTFLRIHEVLIPKEFTRLDEIAELVLSTATDSAGDEAEPDDEEEADDEAPENESDGARPAKAADTSPPARSVSATTKSGKPRRPLPPFSLGCIAQVEGALKDRGEISEDLIRRARSAFSTPDDRCRVALLTSKNHQFGGRSFFFGMQSHQKEFLGACESGWVAVCGDSGDKGTIFLIPWGDFSELLPKLRSSKKSPGMSYLQVQEESHNKLVLSTRPGFENVDLSRYMLRTDDKA